MLGKPYMLGTPAAGAQHQHFFRYISCENQWCGPDAVPPSPPTARYSWLACETQYLSFFIPIATQKGLLLLSYRLYDCRNVNQQMGRL